jgi:hypothetical protein
MGLTRHASRFYHHLAGISQVVRGPRGGDHKPGSEYDSPPARQHAGAAGWGEVQAPPSVSPDSNPAYGLRGHPPSVLFLGPVIDLACRQERDWDGRNQGAADLAGLEHESTHNPDMAGGRFIMIATMEFVDFLRHAPLTRC